MRRPSLDKVDVDVLLGECRELAEVIAEAQSVGEAAFNRRLAIWQALTARGIRAPMIAEASGVGRSAVSFALHKARKAAS